MVPLRYYCPHCKTLYINIPGTPAERKAAHAKVNRVIKKIHDDAIAEEFGFSRIRELVAEHKRKAKKVSKRRKTRKKVK